MYDQAASTRVLGSMLLSHNFDNAEVCIMGYPQDLNKNSKQFFLKTTDQQRIPVILREPIGEYVDNSCLMQIRGKFDGKNIQGQSYNQLLKELCEDFDPESYNEIVKLMNNK